MWDWSLEPTASLYHTANSLEPVHPQFDYLKNTVSVVNDYYRPVENHTLVAQVYDLDSRKVWEKMVKVNVPEDGVANDLLKVEFPDDISQVHFINLVLTDNNGEKVGSNFYWRSNDRYEGSKTLTGPAVSGFEKLSRMKPANVKVKVGGRRVENGRTFVDVTVRNASKTIAFFNRLQLQDGGGSAVRPSYYTDNFFTLMPGEDKVVTIETASENVPEDVTVMFEGWNSGQRKFNLGNKIGR